MARTLTKTEFLLRVMCHPSRGADLENLLVDDDDVRNNVVIACEALQLHLVRVALNREGLGYELRITPGGRLLAEGRLQEAAAAIDSGMTPTRLMGDAPYGALASRIYPGSPPLALSGMSARTWVAEVLRGIATGHLRVERGYLHAVEVKERILVPERTRTRPALALPSPTVVQNRRGGMQTGRHVAMRRGR